MQLIQFDPAHASPLDSGKNAASIPIQIGDREVGIILRLAPKGDTGKREAPLDLIMTVISGTGQVRSGGTIAEIKTGDILILPGAIMHHIWTADSELLATLVELKA